MRRPERRFQLHDASVERVGATERARGQSLAEFSLVLVPLLLVFLGIAQLGFVFNAYVTVANAAREGARAGSIWVADPTRTQAQNDDGRRDFVRSTVRNTMGLLETTAPQLGDNDISVTYWNTPDPRCLRGDEQDPTSWIATDVRRKNHYVCVSVTYHLDLFVPLIADLLPKGGDGRMPIDATSQMVIN